MIGKPCRALIHGISRCVILESSIAEYGMYASHTILAKKQLLQVEVCQKDRLFARKGEFDKFLGQRKDPRHGKTSRFTSD